MSDIFTALANPTRRAILDELTKHNGQTLFELCGRLTMNHGLASSRQAISQHLDVLEDAGLVCGRNRRRQVIRINVSSVLVDDQEKALRFYTDVLGFEKKNDIPLGGGARWLTVVSPADREGTELLLEPDGHPAAGPFKQALVEDGIPYTSFAVDDVRAEYERLRQQGVRFTQEPTAMGPVTTAVLDDTCGNLIQLASEG
jgi:catechol 2,3-dioxygenase-like lactoylglutathione lyase family enzyme